MTAFSAPVPGKRWDKEETMATILEFRRPDASPRQDNTEPAAEDNRRKAEVVVLRKLRITPRRAASN